MYFVEGRFFILYGVGKNLDTFFDSYTTLSQNTLREPIPQYNF